ncbi:FxSxx-COOH system tetratricopeptide repeat protein [Actinoplanes sp. NPDC026619]|uniref:FxSxx-COOH system tetratricopeptide repeat protein n=1 Tax=Actinoplanes sp. NPDC026619 TaxID=3155798 RepID=UPI003409EC96
MSEPHTPLLDALLQVPGLESRSIRDDRVAELSNTLTRDLAFTRSDDAREDLAALLHELVDAPADLRILGEILALRHPGDAAQRFAELTMSRLYAPRRHVYRPEERIVGEIPIRNRNFTGRVELLERLGAALDVALEQGMSTSVMPPALRGMGGVGKTQLVNEYVHRHLDQYDLIWWIPSEEISAVLAALTLLAQRLDLPIADDQQETARTLLNWLAGSDREWLLVYDNADDPASLLPLLPTTGGHVIVTTRNELWSGIGVAIEVDIFRRDESVELIAKRTLDPNGNPPITAEEADQLADKLGDLPLALEQAAAWYVATGMPIPEYLRLLDDHIELLDEGRPPNYPRTVAALVAVALEKLHSIDEAIAQLFALFAYLGGDGIRQSLLSRGRMADLSSPLKEALNSPVRNGQLTRELRRYGLAKTVSRTPSSPIHASADKTSRLQVHRLVQRVLRDTLDAEQREQALRNVQNLLAAAAPGDPDEIGELDLQAEMGPHLRPADMIHSGSPQGRQTVLDHVRFLYISGDYDGSRLLAKSAADEWAKAGPGADDIGVDGHATLLALAHVANATRALGDSRRAAEILQDAYQRLKENDKLGPEHDYTVVTGNQVGHDLRIAGRYREALEFDRQSVLAHRRTFVDEDVYILRAMGNLAVDHRLIGEFATALRLDEEIASHYADSGVVNPQVVHMHINVARDYYGLGHYQAARKRLDEWMPAAERMLGKGHPSVLLAERTYAIAMRKLGHLHPDRRPGHERPGALELIRETRERTVRKFGAGHEHAVAASMSLANTLRQLGEYGEAASLIDESLTRYRKDFTADHPLTLAAKVNQAVLLRATGEPDRALAVDLTTYTRLQDKLAAEHPYTLCAGTSVATGYALTGRAPEALALSERMMELSRATDAEGLRARGGADHPYVLMRAVNLAHDLRAAGASDQADAMFDDAVGRLQALLGPDHPEVLLATDGHRLEGDIEPPPT